MVSLFRKNQATVRRNGSPCLGPLENFNSLKFGHKSTSVSPGTVLLLVNNFQRKSGIVLARSPAENNKYPLEGDLLFCD